MATASHHQYTPRIQPSPLPSSPPELGSIDLAMLSLNDMGIIQTCSPTCERVFGYRSDELAGHHVSTLLPELVDTELVMEGRVNARIDFLCHCAIPFKAQRRDGNCFTSELFINRLSAQNVVVLVRNLDTSR
jgi:PAS domain S-box-containing protein